MYYYYDLFDSYRSRLLILAFGTKLREQIYLQTSFIISLTCLHELLFSKFMSSCILGTQNDIVARIIILIFLSRKKIITFKTRF